MEKKNLICFYDDHLICDYMDQPYTCATCPHNKSKTDYVPGIDRYKWGALILVSTIFGLVLLALHFLIKVLRPL